MGQALASTAPRAYAEVKGSSAYPTISGLVTFYKYGRGTIVVANVSGLPKPDSDCERNVFGFHVHTYGECSGTAQNPFENVGPHYNPYDCGHPSHVGDMPPLFGMDGYAWMSFYTTRFKPSDVIGRAVIIHANPDDFTTQPSGNSGPMIACGKIISVNK